MKNPMQVYCCAREYDILYSLLHINKFNVGKSIFILSKKLPHKKYKEKLEQLDYIEKVIVINDDTLHEELFFKNKLKVVGVLVNLLLIRYRINNVYGGNSSINEIFEEYDITSNLFFLNTALKIHFFRKSTKVNFLEEGIGIYNKNYPKIYMFIRWLLSLGNPYGNDTRVQSVFVSNVECYKNRFKTNNVEEFSFIEELNRAFINEHVKDISFVFDVNVFKTKSDQEIIVLLTQPLSEDGICELNKKNKFYEELYSHLSKKGIVYLKLHPRDTSSYSFCDESYVISGSIPMELVRFDRSINRVISLSSSGVTTFGDSVEIIRLVNDREVINEDVEFKRYLYEL
ncbi:glycosyltransferase family 52 [Vibrio cyclitrophicus]|nr:glycosyltransferase family 52 [Vibrio cyclitrophicus]PMJ29986.1 hypothetical protein BCU25_17805 [Vibrio cyclitrophicus]